MFTRLFLILDTIKFAHSVFALPFALLAMIVAAGGWPRGTTAGLILICMVSARSAAMAFNRLADRDIDAQNPRTKTRPSVTGQITPAFLMVFVLISGGIYWGATWFLNPACFALALPVLAILTGYSYAKRFTSLCHFWLGLALGLAPVAAHLAVRGDLAALPEMGGRWGLSVELFPMLLGLTVLCWAAGFDLIYACQDFAVDSADPRLHSMPKKIGIPKTLLLSSALHLFSVLLLLACGYYAGMGVWYYLAVGLVAALLLYEHWIVSPTDLTRVNAAFFTINGMVSLLLFAAVWIERVILVTRH